MEKFKSIKIILFLAVVLIATSALAKSASELLQEGLYAEEVDGDLDAAIKIYAQIIKDNSGQRFHIAQAMYRQGMCYLKKQQEQQAKLVFDELVANYSDQTKIISKVKPLLQELSNADPAALMPPDTLVYIEIGSPGKQVETILKMLEGTPLENPLATIGGAPRGGGASPGNIVAGFLNPNMMAEFKKIRGMGIGITGIAPNNPPAIVVLFPGKSDALRGLVMGALVLLGKPIEAIEGMQCVEFPDGGGAAYDDTVVILATPPAYTAGQLTSSVKQYKGVIHNPTLASSNKSFAKVNKKDRQGNALTIWANFDQLYTALKETFPDGQLPEQMRAADGIADFKNIDDLIASFSIQENGIALEANVGFKDGYKSLAYDMFHTPKLSKAAFDVVPSGAVALLSVAPSGAESARAQALSEQIRKMTGLEIGGDIFANIEQVTLFVLPSAVSSGETVPGIPPIVSSLGLVLTSQNPRQTRQIMTGLLTATNLIAGQSGDDSEANVGRYQYELVNKLKLHCYTNQDNKTTVLSLNPGLIEASASALGTRKSVTSGGQLKDAMNKLSPGASKLAMINAGGAIRAGGALFLSGLPDDSQSNVGELFAQLADSCDKTTIQLCTYEGQNNFNVRAEISELPPLNQLFGPVMQLSQVVNEAKNQARAEKSLAQVSAGIMKVSRPVAIDGRADDLWSESRQYKIGNVIYLPPSNDEDLSASYKAMWDEKNLYVLIDVTDDSLKNDSDSDMWYQDDCVEVFVDADNSKSDIYGDNDAQYHFDWDKNNPAMDRFQNGKMDGIEFAMVTTENGYRTEIKFPWSTLGVEPSAGKKIGLDVHVNDDDDGGDRDSKLTWRGKEDNAWQTPGAFGTAELAGLIGWWKLDETSGREVADSSGNGNLGKILSGTPKWQSSGGKIDGALLFDGKGDYVHLADESNFDFTGEVTVAAWIKVNQFDKEWQAIVAKGDSAWRLQRHEGTDALEFACTGLQVPGDSSYGGLYGNKPVNDGKWHHVAGVYDGEKMYIYIDSIADVSQPASGAVATNDQPVFIGENAEMTGRFWNGLIDDVRVYNYALSEEQIKALYNEGK